MSVYPLGAWGGRPGGAQKGPDELDLTIFSGYKFRSSSTKGVCRSAPKARNEFKSALALSTRLPRPPYFGRGCY
ncbi:hypothetical protein TNCV_4367451 [Trichonephila clavipes]|nr:hypothetical protein TNCV_4367451 [Trichonephila clavipes]